MVIRQLLQYAIHTLKPLENASFEAHLIVRSILGKEPLDLVLESNCEVSPKDEERIKSIIALRKAGQPLQYLLGTQEFMSLSFFVTPDVLIPRSDTETLVETIIEQYAGKQVSILDIGTGSGCIAISLAEALKGSYVLGIDISPKALEIAQLNAKRNRVNHRVRFERVNILTDTLWGQYDIIVSNPPYIESDVIPTLDGVVKNHEPKSALDGGLDGLTFYRRIVQLAPGLLSGHGMLAFEVGYTQAQAVKSMMEQNFEHIQIKKDLCGNDRVVLGIKKQSEL